MSPFTCIAAFFTIWWTVLFVVLPLGSKSFAEAGITPPAGADPSAPVNPNIKRKFITTTWISALVFAVIFVIVQFNLVDISFIPIR